MCLKDKGTGLTFKNREKKGSLWPIHVIIPIQIGANATAAAAPALDQVQVNLLISFELLTEVK